ncbi:hypothetical protein ABTN54_19915, partial [Acinetobacter baumannii]
MNVADKSASGMPDTTVSVSKVFGFQTELQV